MRAASNVCMSCLKPWPSTPPSRFPAVEGDLVLLHAAVAEHLDLAAGHALGRERVGVAAARLFREQHGEALVAGLGRVGAHEQRHQVGAHRVGDPGLVAEDLVDVALAGGPRLQGGEVGAGVRLGEDRGRQHLAGGDPRQPGRLLLVGAAAEDELGGDLRAGAERADADIGARQLLGDDAHRFLAEAETAELLRDRQAEHAELGHLRDDLERDVAVREVPLVRVRDDLGFREAAHLAAHRLERLVEARVADGRGAVALADRGDERRPVLRGVAAGDEPLDRRGPGGGGSLGGKPQVGRPDELVLAHRQAAERLGEVFAEADLEDQRLGLAEAALVLEAAAVGGHLPQRLGVGR
jgi:hypothetical protein